MRRVERGKGGEEGREGKRVREDGEGKGKGKNSGAEEIESCIRNEWAAGICLITSYIYF